MPTKAPPVSQAWLKEQFDEIDREFILVLDRLNDLKRQGILILAEVRKSGGNISAELEKAILGSSVLSKGIDAKVADENKCN